MPRFIAWILGDGSDPRALSATPEMRIVELGAYTYEIELGVNDATGVKDWRPFATIDDTARACALDRGHLRALLNAWSGSQLYFTSSNGERMRLIEPEPSKFWLEKRVLGVSGGSSWRLQGTVLNQDHPRKQTWTNSHMARAISQMSFRTR